jgi:hypothetical protein
MELELPQLEEQETVHCCHLETETHRSGNLHHRGSQNHPIHHGPQVTERMPVAWGFELASVSIEL